MPYPPVRLHSFRSAVLPMLLGATLALGGCGTGTTPDTAETISPHDFVSTYVDLRLAVLNTGETTELTDSARAAILKHHGVTEDDLLDFVNVHGKDPAFMKAVWDSVEVSLSATRPDAGPSMKPDSLRLSPPRPDRKGRTDGEGVPPTER